MSKTFVAYLLSAVASYALMCYNVVARDPGEAAGWYWVVFWALVTGAWLLAALLRLGRDNDRDPPMIP